ncbi:hypothetical protein ACHAWF_013517 [Thalassiosira exigua]
MQHGCRATRLYLQMNLPLTMFHQIMTNCSEHEWTKTKSPAGATQWIPTPESIAAHGGTSAVAVVPDAHGSETHLPIMFTTDLAMRYDPAYGEVLKRFHGNPDEFTDAFKKAWYKLCHRDMGPKTRHLGPYVPEEDYIWMDPVPANGLITLNSNGISELKRRILDAANGSGVTTSDLVKAAWASSSTYRRTDHRGGANGGRIRLEPQRSWKANDPGRLSKVIRLMEGIQGRFGEAQVSFADLIVLGGNAAIEEAARRAGHANVCVPFVPGRTDAAQSDTDVESFRVLEPTMDGFRNYEGATDGAKTPEASLVDRAHLLSLTAPEMVVLVGGLRVLNANTDGNSRVGVLTDRPGALTNDFFVNLLEETTVWSPANGGLFQGTRTEGEPWVASGVDLVLGSNSQLRAIAESYATADSEGCFVRDFVGAWAKVTMSDRFDLLPRYVELKSKM